MILTRAEEGSPAPLWGIGKEVTFLSKVLKGATSSLEGRRGRGSSAREEGGGAILRSREEGRATLVSKEKQEVRPWLYCVEGRRPPV